MHAVADRLRLNAKQAQAANTALSWAVEHWATVHVATLTTQLSAELCQFWEAISVANQHTSEIILTYSSSSADSFLYYLDESADEDDIT